MSIVIETLNRSLANLHREKQNITYIIKEMEDELVERKADIVDIDMKIQQVAESIAILEGKQNATTSKSKKTKSKSSST